MEKFLIINPFGIGDVLFTTPVIRAIKEAFADSFIGYWCNERVQAILKDDPNIDKIFPISRGDIKKIYDNSKWQGIKKSFWLYRQLRKDKFDVSLDFSLDHRYGWISQAAGIKKRIGFNYKNRGIFLNHKINLSGYQAKHAVEYYLELLKFLSIKVKVENLYLCVNEKSRIKAKAIFKHAGISGSDLVIGIAPGAGGSWGKDAGLKHWPALRFAQLAERLSAELGARIIVLGDETERPLADVIVNSIKIKPIDLVGKTTLEEFAAIINNLSLLVTNDGGPLHMAVALGVKTVSIFGPVDDKVYGPFPLSDQHIVIKKSLPCRPCYYNFKMPVCEQDRECLKTISVDEVFGVVKNILNTEAAK